MCTKTNDDEVLGEIGKFMECLCSFWKHEHCNSIIAVRKVRGKRWKRNKCTELELECFKLRVAEQ